MHRRLPLLLLCLLAVGQQAPADDWPTFRHDFGRTGATTEGLALPLCHLWRHRSPHAPRPAWPAPARRDIWNQHEGLQPEITFDRAYHTSVVGELVYYVSSADDHVYCLGLSDGSLRWSFVADGPVRLSPTVAQGKVYVGADDGCVYCLDAGAGRLLWRRQVAPKTRLIPGNGRIISAWPVRCGVVVEAGTVYCCAGLFPGEGVYVAALDADTGDVRWCSNCDSISPQGHLVVSGSRLFVPTGRTAPVPFDRADGKQLGGHYGSGGGTFALVTDETLVSGPGRMEPTVDFRDVPSAQSLATFRGLHLVVSGAMSYLHSGKSISALNRREWVRLAKERSELQKMKTEASEKLKTAKEGGAAEAVAEAQSQVDRLNEQLGTIAQQQEACTLWNSPSQEPYSMILAGETLFCGGDGRVAAYNAGDGSAVWAAEVDGRAYGLCVANGMLIVSTDKGVIDCFSAEEGER